MAIKRCGVIGATDGDGVVSEQARAEFELGQRRRGRGTDVCMYALARARNRHRVAFWFEVF